jgi:hypothetical protein
VWLLFVALCSGDNARQMYSCLVVGVTYVCALHSSTQSDSMCYGVVVVRYCALVTMLDNRLGAVVIALPWTTHFIPHAM